MTQANVLKLALQGEWEAITTLYRQRPALCNTAPVTSVTGDTLIHIAVQSGRTEAVVELLDLLPEHVRVAKNNRGNTSLHEVARSGNMETARAILKKDEALVCSSNECGETPAFSAAMYGNKEMLIFLVAVSKTVGEEMVRRNDGATILHAATLGGFYDTALEIIEMHPEMAFSRDGCGMTALHLLALSSSSFKSKTIFSPHSVGIAPSLAYEKIMAALYACIPVDAYQTKDCGESSSGPDQGDFRKSSFTERCKGQMKSGIKRMLLACPLVRNVYIAKQKHTWALQLAKRLIEKEAQWSYEHDGSGPQESYGWYQIDNDGDESKKKNKEEKIKKKLERPLILATKFGIVELVEEILKAYPESVEFLDYEAGRNLLHLAAEHRQEHVLKLLKKTKRATAVMADGIDADGNTILHLAAKLGEDKRHVRGPAIHMQWESVWFERVKKLCPAHLVPHRNRSNQTAKQVFTQSHRDLVNQGEKWLKETSNTCIVVSTLIATITFAATFTIPGGNDSTTGLPVLRHHPNFTPFIEYVASSLFFSLVSLAMFISLHTSRCKEEDFLVWLPVQSFVAATALFNSVVFTVAAFMVAFLMVTNWSLPLPVTITDIVLASVGFSCFPPVYLEIIFVPIIYLIDLLYI